MPMLLQLLFTTGLLFTPGFASTPGCTLSTSGVPVQWKNEPIDECCTDPSGIQDEMSLFKPKNSSAVGTCTTKDKPAASTDPRVFGPALWRAFHLIAANFPSPPTEAAHQACVAFIMALPYLVPCRHCGWDLGEFIKRNIENDTVVDPKCFGFSHKTQDFTEPCESPERACMSTYRMTSFFARAHNNVNSHTNPCRKPYTTEEALDQYLAAPDGTCFHNTVWGSKQLCTGPYCSTNRPCTPDGPSRYGTPCYQAGSDSTNFSGTGCPLLWHEYHLRHSWCCRGMRQLAVPARCRPRQSSKARGGGSDCCACPCPLQAQAGPAQARAWH